MKHNANNERIKHKYFDFLKEAKRQSEASVDAVAMAISRFEQQTDYKDFKKFHYEQAKAFKSHLAKQTNQQTGKPLSKATLHSTTRHLKTFFQWLSMQAGYVSKLNYSEMDYFNVSEKDARIANAKRPLRVPTVEQIKRVLNEMPNTTEIECRNRALIAFTLLSGARDSAIASISLKHVDLQNDAVFQDARDVDTKYSKTFTSYFFPVGAEIRQIVVDWLAYLRNEKLFGNDDPLFPKSFMVQNERQEFEVGGIKTEFWSTASPIRAIFKQAFEGAGLQYFNPHSFRKTLASLGEQVCQTPEEFKAWSQNLGHDQVLTTFTSYGEVQQHRQCEVFNSLRNPVPKTTRSDAVALARAVLANEGRG
ncbi:MAG: integrase/recombinase XerD [Arenicella sp.]|jgi:integrase/recombinase XerD